MYASVRCVRSQASSHPRCASSSRIRISSGTAIVGCVSLSWMATFSGSALQSALLAPEAPHEIGQRAGDQKVLLHKAQALPHARGVVGIQDPRERFGRERLRHRADEIAAAEFLKVEVIGGRRGPEPERVDGLAAVAHHGTIEGNADQAGRPADRPGASSRRAPRRSSSA